MVVNLGPKIWEQIHTEIKINTLPSGLKKKLGNRNALTALAESAKPL